MEPEIFEAAEPHLDEIAELAAQHLAAPEFRRVLIELGKVLGERYGVSINLTVDVFDESGERSLPLLTTGLCASSGREPYPTSGDSTTQRYVVADGIRVVPHDRCPNCWQVWDFKWNNPSCSHCGAALGPTCKILLDADVCPNCETGKVTAAEPCCSNCGFEIDPNKVVWG
jgi:hypothetical protein